MNDDIENDSNTFNQAGQSVGKQVNIGRVEGRQVHIGDNVTQTAPREVSFPISNLPPANPHFIGRTAQLQILEQTTKGPMTITQAIAGLGGVGKSQLMLHFAHQHRHAYNIIWWLRVDEALAEDFLALGRALGLAMVGLKQDAAVQVVRNWLNGTERPWLLLCDNADEIEPRDLRQALPSGVNGLVLITSRNPHWETLGEVIHLDVFTEDEVAIFWAKRLGVPPAAQPTTRIELAEALGRLPLALEHAAAYMSANYLNAPAYLTLYQTRRQELLQLAKRPDDYDATITTTWEIAFQKARQTPGAAHLLNICCFLAPDDIPLQLLIEHAEVLPDELGAILTDDLDRNEALHALERYAVLERTGAMLLRIHRLVQTIARDRMGEKRVNKWLEAAVEFLTKAYHFDKLDTDTWVTCGQLMPHLVAVVELADDLGYLTNQVAALNNEAGYYLQQYGDLAGARPYWERALAIREQILGGEHSETAQCLSNLGALLISLGELTEAKPYIERALAIQKKKLEADHPDTLVSLNNLGFLLSEMEDLTGAWPYLEAKLGPEHPNTKIVRGNLAALGE